VWKACQRISSLLKKPESEEGRGGAHHRHREQGGGGQAEQHVAAGDHVEPGGDHGGGVDERGDGRGAGHGVGQPDVERDLGALARGAQEEQQGRGGGQPVAHGHAGQPLLHGQVVQAAQVGEEQEEAQQEAEVADAVDHEGLFPRAGLGRVAEPEADEQVAAEANAFPAQEHHQVVAPQHQGEHGEAEQVEVGEVAGEGGVLPHVADAVEVDERGHAADKQGVDQAQGIQQQAPVHGQAAGMDPGGIGEGKAAGLLGQLLELQEDGRGGEEAAQDGQGGQGAGALGPQPAAEQRVEQGAAQGQQRDERQGQGEVEAVVHGRSSRAENRRTSPMSVPPLQR